MAYSDDKIVPVEFTTELLYSPKYRFSNNVAFEPRFIKVLWETCPKYKKYNYKPNFEFTKCNGCGKHVEGFYKQINKGDHTNYICYGCGNSLLVENLNHFTVHNIKPNLWERFKRKIKSTLKRRGS